MSCKLRLCLVLGSLAPAACLVSVVKDDPSAAGGSSTDGRERETSANSTATATATATSTPSGSTRGAGSTTQGEGGTSAPDPRPDPTNGSGSSTRGGGSTFGSTGQPNDTVGGDRDCFAPGQNLEPAPASGAVGCPCEPGDADVCFDLQRGLTCAQGFWRVVEFADGPCLSPPDFCNGRLVPTKSDCVPGADCVALTTGQWCVETSPAPCPPGARRLDAATPCGRDETCTEAEGSPGVRCATRTYTVDGCKAAYGLPLSDPDTAPMHARDCAGYTALGVLYEPGWKEASLCCATRHVRDCLSPKALEEPACQSLFRSCGARAGDTCTRTEYCAYQPNDLCGAADAESKCLPRPTCWGWWDQARAPVCGCDGMTYEVACLANAAGTGIREAKACPGGADAR